jgi:hypothetical protein
MSADWFCKIGEKKFGPLSGQQLKTIVAKGQLRPEHFVRRGSEGPWVPAGRIKGLFPANPAGDDHPQGKTPLPTDGKRRSSVPGKPPQPPKATTVGLPTAAEVPSPPVVDITQGFSLGGHHKHHVELNVDSLNIETTPVPVTRRKVKAGLQGLKKDERKKLTVGLLCLTGGGTTIGLIVIIWAIATGKFHSPSSTDSKSPVASRPSENGTLAGMTTAGTSAAPTKPAETWRKPAVDRMIVGDVEVFVLNPRLGEPPKGAKSTDGEVLIIPVNLSLKAGATKQVALTSWADESMKSRVVLKDDQNTGYALLDQVSSNGNDVKAVPPNDRIQVQLVFQAPSTKELKFLELILPSSALHAAGPAIAYRIDASEIRGAKAKTVKPGNRDASENASKDDKARQTRTKAADNGAQAG